MTTQPRGPESGRKVVTTPLLAERFWAKVAKTEGCWLWRGFVGASGYGTINVPGMRGPVPAHRVAYAVAHGECPPGLVVMHSCDTKHCVRPDHLEVGPQAKNMADAKVRGRLRKYTPPAHCSRCREPLEGNRQTPYGRVCAPCHRAAASMRGRAKSIQRRWNVTRSTPEHTWEEVVEAVGERRALIFARNHGLYAFPFPETLTVIAKDHNMSRERVRQIVVKVSRLLGLNGGTFWGRTGSRNTIPQDNIMPTGRPRGRPKGSHNTPKEPKTHLLLRYETQTLARLVAAGEPNLVIALELAITERAVRTRINALAGLLPGEAPARRRIAEWWVSQDAEAK